MTEFDAAAAAPPSASLAAGMWQALGLSFQLALWTALVLLVVCLPLAWWFGRSRARWLPWLESLLSLGLVLPPTVLGFFLLLALSPRSALGAWLDATLGLRLVFSFEGLVFASVLASFPFMLGPLKTGARAVPEALLEAGRCMGRGELELFVLLALPRMKTAMLTGLLATVAHTLGEFGVVMMIGGSIPGVTKVVSIALFEAVEAGRSDLAWQQALVLLILSYAGTLGLKYLERGSRRSTV